MRGCRGHHQGWSEAEGATGSCGQRASVVVSLGEGKRGKQVWDWPVLIASMGPGAPGLSLPIQYLGLGEEGRWPSGQEPREDPRKDVGGR